MKEIQQIQMWQNGVFVEAIYLNAWAVNVTLNTSAVFCYNLLDASQQRLQDGNLTMTGEAYTKWQSDNYAWDWIAAQLNLTIIGDYVPPVPETIAEIYVGEPSVLEVEPRSSVLGQIRQDAPLDEIVTE
jgi:hypothetical protein